MSVTLILVSALLLDAWLGEPRRFHPLAGFGNLAGLIEQRIYTDTKIHGICAVLFLAVPPTLLVLGLSTLTWHVVLDIVVLYLAIGWNSLCTHARQVRNALLTDDIKLARLQAGRMVSRDTTELNQVGVTKGTIESVLENGNDAIFGVIFWFIVAGAPGALLYRLINTLDAMWGYRNDRYRHFGWAAARFDDCLNFIPARLTAFSYALAGNLRHAFRCWWKQGATWKSPNAGPVMAAGAGSLNISLGGAASYQGNLEQRPVLGTGRLPEICDINQSLALIHRALFLWVVMICLGEGLAEFFASA